jgi:hypothetical protein
MAGSFERSNEPSDPTKGGELCDSWASASFSQRTLLPGDTQQLSVAKYQYYVIFT